MDFEFMILELGTIIIALIQLRDTGLQLVFK